ncbi:MAG: tetratricopeptide repeat protein [Burkholderiales bacterium]
MSLINQVLQDLEKRHASGPALKSLPPQVRAVPAFSGNGGRKAVLVIVLALVAALAWIIYIQHGADGPTRHTESMPIRVPPPLAKEPSAPLPATEAAIKEPQFNPVSRLSDGLEKVSPREAVATKPPASRKKPPPAKTLSTESIGAPAPAVQTGSLPASPAEIVLALTADTPLPALDVPAKRAAPGQGAGAGEAPSVAQVPVPDPGLPTINKQMRELTSMERAELAFRKGAAQLQEGRANVAELAFRDALKEDAQHASARQALLGLLLESGRSSEAEQLLRDAIELNPRQPRYAMMLARIQTGRGDVSGGINTLAAALPYVQSDADYFAFLAALLQKEGRHREATDYYRAALHTVPGNGIWMMGMAISLRAANLIPEARDAFQRALDSRQLKPELKDFVERQLRELSALKKP